METLVILIGLGLAYVTHRWKFAATLLSLGEKGLELAHATGLDKRIPETVRKAAEQAVIQARQKEVEALVEKLLALQAQGKRDEQAAIERGRELGAGMDVTIIEPDGTEPTSKPFKTE